MQVIERWLLVCFMVVLVFCAIITVLAAIFGESKENDDD